jgi:hypothetical protein
VRAGWVYYGFVTSSIPIAHGNVGCASGGNGAGLLGGGTTLAHEVGHQAGLAHAPCGAVGTPQAGFPLYEPYDTGNTTVNASGNTVYQDASIGEYGLNISSGTIFNPNPARPNNGKDLMSYCGNRWVAIYTHNYMINNTNLNPVALVTGLGSGDVEGSVTPQQENRDNMKPFITLLGSISANGSVEVTSVARVPTRELTMNGLRTAYTVELLDEEGNVATSAPVFTIPMHQGSGGCGCGEKRPKPAEPPFAFIAAMPDVTAGSAIRIQKNEKVVWERRRPDACPILASVDVAVRKGKLHVSWEFKAAPPIEPEVWLRWSEDGEHWNGLAVGLKGRSVELDPKAIPADRAAIQVIAHDGYSSVSANSEIVELPPTPLGLSILHPLDN